MCQVNFSIPQDTHVLLCQEQMKEIKPFRMRQRCLQPWLLQTFQLIEHVQNNPIRILNLLPEFPTLSTKLAIYTPDTFTAKTILDCKRSTRYYWWTSALQLVYSSFSRKLYRSYILAIKELSTLDWKPNLQCGGQTSLARYKPLYKTVHVSTPLLHDCQHTCGKK